jgi:hypothetical protein
MSGAGHTCKPSCAVLLPKRPPPLTQPLLLLPDPQGHHLARDLLLLLFGTQVVLGHTGVTTGVTQTSHHVILVPLSSSHHRRL